MSSDVNDRYRATELEVSLENRLGALARLCSTLGEARVNITAILAPEARGKVRVIVDDLDEARGALKKARIRFSEKEVMIIELYNRPGVFGRVAAKLAEAKINIQHVYVSTSPYAWTKVVLAVSDVAKALRVLGS